MNLIKCNNCNRDIPSDSNFCCYCGSLIRKLVKCSNPECNFIACPDKTFKYCPKCGRLLIENEVLADNICDTDIYTLSNNDFYMEKAFNGYKEFIEELGDDKDFDRVSSSIRYCRFNGYDDKTIIFHYYRDYGSEYKLGLSIGLILQDYKYSIEVELGLFSTLVELQKYAASIDKTKFISFVRNLEAKPCDKPYEELIPYSSIVECLENLKEEKHSFNMVFPFKERNAVLTIREDIKDESTPVRFCCGYYLGKDTGKACMATVSILKDISYRNAIKRILEDISFYYDLKRYLSVLFVELSKKEKDFDYII